MENILEIKDLTVTVAVSGGVKTLVDKASLEIPKNSIVALVGGSGSGKTTMGLSILRLLPPQLTFKSGQILFDGRDLLTMPEAQLRTLRGKSIGMVFQEPLSALNPLLTIGAQIDEILLCHTEQNVKQRSEKILSL